MRFTRRKAKFLLGLLICAAIVGAFLQSLARLHIDFDILNALPRTDDVTCDAREIMKQNPAMDRVLLDLSRPDGTPDRDRLVAAAETVAARLRQSGLFRSVGVSGFGQAMPKLLGTVTGNLPLLFDENDLAGWDETVLSRKNVVDAVGKTRERLLGLEGIGQADGVARDPLELRFRVLARMMRMAFFQNVQVYRDQLLSGDGKHLLLVCEPATSATDTTFSRELNRVLDELSASLGADTAPGKGPVQILALGSFRYALDNEKIVRRDAAAAALISTLGIAGLLLLAFRRPWIGLLALVPAVAGAMLAFIVYSLFTSRISALAMGFGGALISITVDHSTAYLLFLDRQEETRASHASREVWAVGLFAVLTTAVAFSVLVWSGFPLMAQLGIFAALGVVLSVLFIHLVFPLLIPGLSAARRPPLLPMEGFLKRVTASLGWGGLGVAVALALCGAFLAKPDFRVDLQTMNTVLPETLQAEKVVSSVWGNIMEKVYVMLEGEDVRELQRLSDQVSSRWEEELRTGFLRSGFTPSMILPGPERAKRNLEAWGKFWNPDRVKRLREHLAEAGEENGFSPSAFDPFLEQVESPRRRDLEIPENLYDLFGISRKKEGTGWILLASATPGETYDGSVFFQAHRRPAVRVFDPNLYSGRLAVLLSHTFLRMLLIVASGTVFLLCILFFDVRLVLLTLAPLIFSLILTLATLRILGRPLDIPSLMLAIVIFGMGVNFGILFVRAQQRFLREEHPSQGTIRMAVFMDAATTMLGMGALALSRHAVLRSVGIVSFLGIGYSLLGAFLLLPPCLAWLYRPRAFVPCGPVPPGSSRHRRAVMSRFALLETYPRFFARVKMKIDPLFPRLADLVPSEGTVLDIGCGYGVPAAWLLTLHPRLRFVGLDPDEEKTRIAARVLGASGRVLQGNAQDLPADPGEVDAVLLLDVGHYLPDVDLERLLVDLRRRLTPSGGPLVMRITIPTDRSRPWRRLKEAFRLRFARPRHVLRTPSQISNMLERTGFQLRLVEDEGRDVCWFVAVPAATGKEPVT